MNLKLIISVIILQVWMNSMYASRIDSLKVRNVALNAYSEFTNISKKQLEIFETVPVFKEGELVYTIFNIKGSGHIIVANEDCAEPILGYGLKSHLKLGELNPGLESLLNGYSEEIMFIRRQKIPQHQSIQQKWDYYARENETNLSLKSYSVGSKLVKTNWGQSSPYNIDCPLVSGTNNRCVVGCNGVALAQLLNYWNCKVFPDSTNSYYCWTLDSTLTINFYDKDYDWSAMDTDVDAVSELMYHSALAVNTVPWTDTVAGSSLYNIRNALQNYFGFNTGDVENDDLYTALEWSTLLKNEIDAGRPLFYAAQSTTSFGHTWIIDGYDSNNKFHCNWGWANQDDENDEFYELSDLSPLLFNFNQDHKALIGVYPILDACYGLSGADFICTTESYSVLIPSTASVLWSKSSNLAQVGVNTNPTYTVSKATSGSGSVTATIKNSQGQTFLTRTKTVWVGNPGTPTTTPSGYPTLEIGLGGLQPVSLFRTPGFNGGTINWWSSGSIEPVSSTNGTTCTFEAVTLGTGNFYVTVQNTCPGVSPVGGGTVNVVSGGGGQLMLVLAPNPATDESTITIATTEEQTVMENAEWDFEVFDNAQNLKAAKTKLKSNSTQLQTTGWKEGVYAVRVNYKPKGKPEEILTGKLVVTK